MNLEYIYIFFLNDITEKNELFHNILMHWDGAVYMHLSICLSINIIYNITKWTCVHTFWTQHTPRLIIIMMKPGHDMSFFFKPSRIPVNHEHDSFLVKRKKWKPQIKCYLVNVVYQIITCYTNISNNYLKPRMKPSRIPGNHEQWLHAYIVHSTLFSATCSSSTP